MTAQGPNVRDDIICAEVLVIDTDALPDDACDALLGSSRSQLLRAIDTGVAHATMSDKTFHELGWMSAKCARGRGVVDTDLRALIEREYLPRIPVVAATSADGSHWMPDARESPTRMTSNMCRSPDSSRRGSSTPTIGTYVGPASRRRLMLTTARGLGS